MMADFLVAQNHITSDTVNVIVHHPPKEADTAIYYFLGAGVLVLLWILFTRSGRRFIKNARPSEYEVSLAGFQISGKLEYYSIDQEVAWKIYVELVTRASCNRLAPGTGMLREVLNSFYQLFGTLRTLIKDAGPEMARSPRKKQGITVAALLLTIMNNHLRPFLSRWHPLLSEHEKAKKEDQTVFQHETLWNQNITFRNELEDLQNGLEEYVDMLLEIAEGKKGKRKQNKIS